MQILGREILDSTEDLDRVTLGRAIAARRVTLGMKRKDLAEASALSYPYIAEIENGGKSPSQRALNAIAEALKVPPSELLLYSEQISDAPESHMQLATVAMTREPRSSSPRKTTASTDSSANRLIEEMREELRLLSRRVSRLDDEVRGLRALLDEGDG